MELISLDSQHLPTARLENCNVTVTIAASTATLYCHHRHRLHHSTHRLCHRPALPITMGRAGRCIGPPSPRFRDGQWHAVRPRCWRVRLGDSSAERDNMDPAGRSGAARCTQVSSIASHVCITPLHHISASHLRTYVSHLCIGTRCRRRRFQVARTATLPAGRLITHGHEPPVTPSPPSSSPSPSPSPSGSASLSPSSASSVSLQGPMRPAQMRPPSPPPPPMAEEATDIVA